MYRKDPQHRFCMSDWDFVERLGTHSKLFRNRFTSKCCEEYLVDLCSEHERQCFQERLSHPSPFIVRVLHLESFSNFNEANMFTHYNVRIFMEHIRFRLSEIAELPENYIHGLLEDTLEGFKTVFEEFQPVRVTDAMICINEDKKIKVWLSQNLLDNYANTKNSVTEQIMIQDIFSIFRRFSQCCDDRPADMNFAQAFEYLEKKKISHINKISWGSAGASTDISKTAKSIARTAYKTNNPTSTTLSMQNPKRLNVQNLKNQSPPQQTDNKNKKASIISTRSNRIIGQNPSLLQLQEEQRGHVHSMVDKNSYVPNVDTSKEQPPEVEQRCGRQSIIVRIESARTTSKNISIHHNFIELDKNQLQQQLLDEKKSKEARLEIIQMARVNQSHDQNVQRICNIFNHALKYDPFMYQQLQKAHGRISRINNSYVLKKIIEMTDIDSKHHKILSPNDRDTRVARIRTHNEIYSPQTGKGHQERIRKILQIQRQKRNRTVYNKKISLDDVVNKTNPPQRNDPKYNSQIKQPNKSAAEPKKVPDYISELESLFDPTVAPDQKHSRPSPNTQSKKKQKTKFYKDFKEEVQKLLFD